VAGRSEDPRFRASPETEQRWGAARRVTVGLGASAAAFVAVRIVRGGGLRSEAAVSAAVGLVATLVWVAAYYVYQRRPGYLSDGALWAGMASLTVFEIRSSGLAEGLRIRDRRVTRLTRRVGAVAARLEVRVEGLVWTFGTFARLVGVRGQIRVPWSGIKHVEVGDVPGTIHRMGGGISVVLDNGQTLDGEFFGSRDELSAALERSPLGSAPE